MREHNAGNDDRRWKARNRRWGKTPVTYDTIAGIDLIARNRFADVEALNGATGASAPFGGFGVVGMAGSLGSRPGKECCSGRVERERVRYKCSARRSVALPSDGIAQVPRIRIAKRMNRNEMRATWLQTPN
jgi:hypothetical protein